MALLANTYPPYAGDEPYLQLLFAPADVRAARELTGALASRGVRVWYAEETPADATTLAARQAHANGASLLVLLASDAARSDRDVKAQALWQQSHGKPLIVVNLGHGDSGLALGLSPDHPQLGAGRRTDLRAVAEELVRTEGFSYELIGEPVAPVNAAQRTRTLALAGMAAVAVALVVAGLHLGWFVDDGLHADDTLPLTSPALIVAAREALGGAAITPESAATVEALRLSALPDDPSELDAFCGLTRLEIPQAEAARATELLEAGISYDIVLVG